MEIAIIIGIAIIGIWIAIAKAKNEANERENISRQLVIERNRSEEVEKKKNEIERKEKKVVELIAQEQATRNEFQSKFIASVHSQLVDRVTAFKWVASLISDISIVAENEYIKQLTKSYSVEKHNRALKITDLTAEKKKLIEENKILKYEIEYIKALIPAAEDAFEYDDIQVAYNDFEKYSNYLSREEFNALSDTEKNNRTLEYYRKRKKTNWEIGRDFERYVGYLYEQKGYTVDYYGIEMKMEDLGRDLIARRDQEILIIQCKYWSKTKIIHEKHIAQLFGTTKTFEIENPDVKKVGCIFITHTRISEQAKKFCRALNVDYIENMEIGDYPLIKCHNNRDQNGLETRIYHLPMDQQYDKTKIERKRGDFWAMTVEEAEGKGYRRAYKWHPYEQ